MTDSVLGLIVVIAPTLFALCIELISEEKRKNFKWRVGVITPSTKLVTLFNWRHIGRGVRKNSSSPTWVWLA